MSVLISFSKYLFGSNNILKFLLYQRAITSELVAAVNTVECSGQDLLPQTPLDFISSPAVGSKFAVTQSCTRYLQLQS